MPKVQHVDAANSEAPKPAEAKTFELRPPVEFKLPSGRVIRMEKPAISTHVLMPDWIASFNALTPGKPDSHSLSINLMNARMMSFVQAVDGKEYAFPPRNAGEVIGLMTLLGEDGCDAVSDVYTRHFAPITYEQLEIIKK